MSSAIHDNLFSILPSIYMNGEVKKLRSFQGNSAFKHVKAVITQGLTGNGNYFGLLNNLMVLKCH